VTITSAGVPIVLSVWHGRSGGPVVSAMARSWRRATGGPRRCERRTLSGAARPSQNSSDEPDPVVQDFWSGASMRELAEARDDLERARYDDAVRKARTVGFSSGEIGRVLGVSKRLLHRCFGRRA